MLPQITWLVKSGFKEATITYHYVIGQYALVPSIFLLHQTPNPRMFLELSDITRFQFMLAMLIYRVPFVN